MKKSIIPIITIFFVLIGLCLAKNIKVTEIINDFEEEESVLDFEVWTGGFDLIPDIDWSDEAKFGNNSAKITLQPTTISTDSFGGRCHIRFITDPPEEDSQANALSFWIKRTTEKPITCVRIFIFTRRIYDNTRVGFPLAVWIYPIKEIEKDWHRVVAKFSDIEKYYGRNWPEKKFNSEEIRKIGFDIKDPKASGEFLVDQYEYVRVYKK